MGWFGKDAPVKDEAPKKKMCCACPETKVPRRPGSRSSLRPLQGWTYVLTVGAAQAPRDECIATHGEFWYSLGAIYQAVKPAG